MVAFDSDERLKCAVDDGAMEGTTGTSQQADQPSVTPASAQASTLLPVMERHLQTHCVRSLRAICASSKSLGHHRRSLAYLHDFNDDFSHHLSMITMSFVICVGTIFQFK